MGDVLKGMIAVWIGQWGLSGSPGYPLAVVAFGAFLGHCFPVYLAFKGGKGVATALGIFLMISPLVVLLAIPIFVVTTYLGKFVSLGSMASAASFPVLLSWLHYPRNRGSFPVYCSRHHPQTPRKHQKDPARGRETLEKLASYIHCLFLALIGSKQRI